MIALLGVSLDPKRVVSFEEGLSLAHRHGLAYFELADVGSVLRHLVALADRRPGLHEARARRHGTRECLRHFCQPLGGFLLTVWIYGDLCLAYALFLGFDYASGQALAPSTQVGVYFGCIVLVLTTYVLGLLVRLTLFRRRQPGLLREAAIALSGLLLNRHY